MKFPRHYTCSRTILLSGSSTSTREYLAPTFNTWQVNMKSKWWTKSNFSGFDLPHFLWHRDDFFLSRKSKCAIFSRKTFITKVQKKEQIATAFVLTHQDNKASYQSYRSDKKSNYLALEKSLLLRRVFEGEYWLTGKNNHQLWKRTRENGGKE